VDARFAPVSRAARDEARARWGVARDAKVVLFVGRLVPKKGIASVVETQRALAADGVVLLAVGDGPLAAELERAPNLVRRPRVPAESMPEIYAAADALLLPSRGEGLPLTVQEALCSGMPAVVSDDPAFASNLVGAQGVALCTDARACIDALRRCLADPPARQEVAASARLRWGEGAAILRYEALFAEVAAEVAASREKS
jgi:glycosyltransferase involved in cell wall biosynthesis